MKFHCSLCGDERHYQSIQKGVGAGWRKAPFLVYAKKLWFCPLHVPTGDQLAQTIEMSVEHFKADILESVKKRIR